MGRFWQVQLRTLLVGVTPESLGQQRQFLPKDPAKPGNNMKPLVAACLSVPANVSTEQMKVLSDNEKLHGRSGANVTPAIYYMSKENTLQQAVGLPDQKTLNIIMRNK